MTALEKQLLEAMNNAMCDDYCYDLNCSACQHARLLAMEAVVLLRVQQRWEQIVAPLRAPALDGLIPKSVIVELAAVSKALKGNGKL